ncbi:unnamed protein product [marine sediment metagenome]|uniref:Uncharacterized protein n=1 Tax=marine sediment metagenome TaxID=412755 RepID=X0TAN8_9ZZZZ
MSRCKSIFVRIEYADQCYFDNMVLDVQEALNKVLYGKKCTVYKNVLSDTQAEEVVNKIKECE